MGRDGIERAAPIACFIGFAPFSAANYPHLYPRTLSGRTSYVEAADYCSIFAPLQIVS